MDKKKAVVCTVLFVIVVFGIFVATFFLKNEYGDSLFDVIAPCICGAWMAGKTKTFYNWLRGQ